MKWLRYLFLLVVLAGVGCSSAPPPEQMVEDAPAAEVDAAAEADALAR